MYRIVVIQPFGCNTTVIKLIHSIAENEIHNFGQYMDEN